MDSRGGEQKVESLQMLLQATPTLIQQQQQQQADGINNFFTADSESSSSKEIKSRREILEEKGEVDFLRVACFKPL